MRVLIFVRWLLNIFICWYCLRRVTQTINTYIYIYIYIWVGISYYTIVFFVVEVFTQVTKCFFEVRGLIRQPARARLGETHKLLYTSARRPPPQRPSSLGEPHGPRSSKFRVADGLCTLPPTVNANRQSWKRVTARIGCMLCQPKHYIAYQGPCLSCTQLRIST